MSFLASGGANLGTAYGAIIIGTDAAIRNINILGGALRASAANASATGKDFFTAGLLMSTMGAAGIGAVKSIVSVGASFDKQMSAVVATLGQDAIPLMGELSDKALQIGADTAFTANQAGQAMEELAKAGVSAEDILGGAADATASLAAATGTDIATAATVISNSMNIFDLSADQASHAADIITTALNESSADINDFRAGLRNLGPIAATFGVSMEDVAAAVATFTNFGLKGADAGVSLARGIEQASKPTQEAIDLMQKYGITVFDTQGKFVGFAALFDNLQQSLAGATDEQKAYVISTIFGAEAQDVMNLAVKNGSTEYRRIRGEIDNTGAAQEAAAARLDNLAGDWEKFRGTMQSVAIEMLHTINPALRVFVKGLDSVAHAMEAIPAPAKRVITVLLALGSAFLLAAGANLLFGQRIRDGINALKELGIGLGLISGPVAALIGVLALLGVAYAKNIFGLRDAVNGLAGTVSHAFGQIKTAFGKLGPFLDFLFHSDSGQANHRKNIIMLSHYAEALEKLGFSVKRAGELTNFLEDIHRPLRTLRKDFLVGGRALGDFFDIVSTGNLDNLDKFEKRLRIVFGDKGEFSIAEATIKMSNAVENLRKAFRKSFGFDPSEFFSLDKILKATSSGFNKFVDFLHGTVNPIIAQGLAGAVTGAAFALQFLADNLDNIRRGLNFTANLVSNVLVHGWSVFSKLMHGDVSGAISEVYGWLQRLGDGVKSIVGWVLDVGPPKVISWAEDIWDWLLNKGLPGLGKMVGRLIDWTLDVGIPTVTGWVANIAGDIWSWLKGIYPGLVSFAGDILSWTLNVGAPAVIGWVVTWANKLWDWIVGQYPTLLHMAGSMLSWTLDVGVPSIIGTITNVASNLWDFVASQFPGLKSLIGKIISWTLDVPIPEITGPIAQFANDMWGWVSAQYPKLKTLAGNVESWTLSLTIPQIIGGIQGFAADVWGEIKAQYPKITSVVGTINNWLISIGVPDITGGIALFALNAWAFIQSKYASLTTLTGEIKTWTLTVGVPTITNLPSEVTGWVQTFLDSPTGANVVATLKRWSMVLDDPNDVNFSTDLSHPVQQELDKHQRTSVLLYKWYLTLTEPNVQMTDAQITQAAQDKMTTRHLVVTLANKAWDLVLGAPGIKLLFFLPATINEFLNKAEPIRARIDTWDLNLIKPTLLFLSNPVNFINTWIIQEVKSQIKDPHVNVPSWVLKFPEPAAQFAETISESLNRAIHRGLGIFGIHYNLRQWFLDFGIPVIGQFPSWNDIWNAVWTKLKALGDIHVPWANKFIIDFPDFGIGDGPTNTEISKAAQDIHNQGRAGTGGGASRGGNTQDQFAPKVDTSGLERLQTALDRVSKVAEPARASMGNVTTALASMSAQFNLAQLSITSTMTAMSTAISTRLQTAMILARVAVSTGTASMVSAFTIFGAQATSSVSIAMAGITSKIQTAMTNGRSAISSGTSSMLSTLRTFASNAGAAGQSAGDQFRAGISLAMFGAIFAVQSAVSSIQSAMASVGDGAFSIGYTAGENMGLGLAGGILSTYNAVVGAANAIANAANSALQRNTKQASPSKLWQGYGLNMVNGLILGLVGNMYGLNSAVGSVTDTMLMNPAQLAALGNSALSAQPAGSGAGAASTVNNYNIAGINIDQAEELLRWGKFVEGLPGAKTTSGV